MIALAVDVLECSVRLCEWLVGVVKVKGDISRKLMICLLASIVMCRPF